MRNTNLVLLVGLALVIIAGNIRVDMCVDMCADMCADILDWCNQAEHSQLQENKHAAWHTKCWHCSVPTHACRGGTA